MRQRVVTLTLAAALVTAIACNDEKANLTNPTTPVRNNIITFRGVMSGAQEVPANTSPATGLFTATLDTVTNVFIYDLLFSGLSSPINNGHIHGPAAAGANAGTTINFNTLPGATFSFGQISGGGRGQATLVASTQITATINGDSLKKLLLAGLLYSNIHTAQFGGGEIRAQILRQ
jgi:hypothetical protein